MDFENPEWVPLKEYKTWREMAGLAAAAYADGGVPHGWTNVTKSLHLYKDDLVNQNGQWFFAGLHGTQAAVFAKGGRVVLAIRGTDDGPDGWQNAQLPVSSSYWKTFKPLLTAIEKAYPNHAVSITGHSLGGAAVHQMAAHQAHLGLSGKLDFYAFSSPILDTSSPVHDVGFMDDKVYGLLNPLTPYSEPYRNLYYFPAEGGTVAKLREIHSIDSLIYAMDKVIETTPQTATPKLVEANLVVIFDAAKTFDQSKFETYLPALAHQRFDYGPGFFLIDGNSGNQSITGFSGQIGGVPHASTSYGNII